MKYYDNAATTPLTSEMKEYLTCMLSDFGNPSSTHSEGNKVRGLIEEVREKVAKFVKADSGENIYFTSSGSASNTLGIQGYALKNKCSILYSPTSHKSILKTINNLVSFYGIRAVELKVDRHGNIDTECLYRGFKQVNGDILVVIEYANSEIGTIQDVKTISDIVHEYNGKLFVDCTGSISSIPLDVVDLNVDMAAFSAHKIGALKGVGVLYKKSDIVISPLVFGGQEQGLFAGTENVLGILSLGKAIDLIDYSKTSRSRDFVWNKVRDVGNIYLVGAPIDGNRLVNNLYVCVKGTRGSEIAALMDDIYNIQISTGSACNNGSLMPSSTSLSIGLSEEEANSCVRVTFSGNETEDELKELCKGLCICIDMLRNEED